MDPASQGLLGASFAQSPAGEDKLLAAGLLGGVSGLVPDLDTLIYSTSDPLLFLEYHRQFTHSLAFVPIGALVCASLLYWGVRNRLSFAAAYGFCFLGYGSHGLLDACTTYGTQLLWPFSDLRVAWSIVAVVDPAFTLPILALLAAAVRLRRVRYARLAAAWAALYLALGAFQQSRAADVGADIAAERGHVPVRLEVKPALGSVLLWKVIYEHDGRYYVDAVRTGMSLTAYPGESIRKLDLQRDFPWLDEGTQQFEDVQRFRRIAHDFLAVDPARPERIVDMRYSMVPNEIAAFWAIVPHRGAAPDAHVEFVTTREARPAQALRLLEMLFP